MLGSHLRQYGVSASADILRPTGHAQRAIVPEFDIRLRGEAFCHPRCRCHPPAEYFVAVAGSAFDRAQVHAIDATMLAAYRWQYIVSGVQDPRYLGILGPMINADQGARINAALAPIVGTMH